MSDDGFDAVECGKGWASLYKPLIERCRAERVQIAQIKEKFGGLRFYVYQGSDALHDVIRLAEEKSFTICEVCGTPGVLRKDGGCLRTRCDAHVRSGIWEHQ